MKKLFAIVIFFIPMIVFAQSDTISISGVVKYSRDSSCAWFAAVYIYNNNQLITGDVADVDGNFNIDKIAYKDSISIKITAIGVEDYKTIIYPSRNQENKYKFYIGKYYSPEHLNKIKKQAKKDIAKGKVQLLDFGYPIITGKILNRLTRKYGFTYSNQGCNIYDGLFTYVETYNAVVYKHLNKRNKVGWEEKLEKEISDYIDSITIKTNP